MKKRLLIIIFSLSFINTLYAGKKDFKVWHLNVVYYIALAECAKFNSSDCRTIIKNLKEEIAITEKLFSAKPALKIKPVFKYIKSKGGRELEHLSFRNKRKLNKYMDKYFDNVATSKTNGHLTILVVKSLTVKGKSIGGIASFPHRVTPFKRKRGLISVYTALPSVCPNNIRPVVTHELGHSLSLKHTFEPYIGGSRCNKDYKKWEKGKGSSKKYNANGQVIAINVMDYGDSYTVKVGNKSYSCTLPYYINACQAKRAALQRRIYMSKDGKTHYRKLTGLR